MQAVNSPHAPAAVGPYSAAIEHDGLLFVSGQLPLDPLSGQMSDDIKEQTARSLENIKALLEAAGSSMDKVLKTTVLLTDISTFAAVNEVYASYFSVPFPARACFEVSALPKGASVEIECIACR